MHLISYLLIRTYVLLGRLKEKAKEPRAARIQEAIREAGYATTFPTTRVAA